MIASLTLEELDRLAREHREFGFSYVRKTNREAEWFVFAAELGMFWGETAEAAVQLYLEARYA